MATSPPEAKPCPHPAIGSADDTQQAQVGDQYAARHDPFVYFHSIIDTPARATSVVPLDQLTGHLRTITTTPNISFTTPTHSTHGHATPCLAAHPSSPHLP